MSLYIELGLLGNNLKLKIGTTHLKDNLKESSDRNPIKKIKMCLLKKLQTIWNNGLITVKLLKGYLKEEKCICWKNYKQFETKAKSLLNCLNE